MVTKTPFKSNKLREGVIQFMKLFIKVLKTPLLAIFKKNPMEPHSETDQKPYFEIRSCGHLVVVLNI